MKWEVLKSEYLFREPWLTARRDHVKLPSGAELEKYYVLEYPEFCNVIAITKDGKMILERQYRHARGLVGYEIPAGCVEEGETPLQAAKRELYEETGYVGGEWKQILSICPNTSACNNCSHSFLAVGVEPTGSQHLEATEDIKVYLVPPTEVLQMLLRDEFQQAMMAAALWKYFALENKWGTNPSQDN